MITIIKKFFSDALDSTSISIVLAATISTGVLLLRKKRNYRRKLLAFYLLNKRKALARKRSEGTAAAAMVNCLVILGVLGLLVLIGFLVSWWLAGGLLLGIILVVQILDMRDKRKRKKEEKK